MSAPARRILLALESSGPGGAEQMVLHLALGLRESGFDPVVASLRPGWMTERAEREGIAVWFVPQDRGLALGWIYSFARRMRAARISLLHSHEFAMNVYGGVAAWLARIPSVATIHGHHWVTARPARRMAYRVLRRSGMPLVAVSQDLSRFLASGLGIGLERFHVIPNGIPVGSAPLRDAETMRAARASAGLPGEGRLALAVGNLYPVKGHDTLLRAVAQLPLVSLAIAGRGEEEERLRGLAAELGIADRVHLLGLRDDVSTLLSAADVFVQPSNSEGLPLAVLEAMAHGLPVVASDVGGIPEAVANGVTGILTAPRDPESLAQALRSVLEERNDRGAALGIAGRERVLAEFSAARMTQRYAALYAKRGGWS